MRSQIGSKRCSTNKDTTRPRRGRNDYMQFLLEVQVYILTSVSPRVSIGASNEEWFKQKQRVLKSIP